MNISGFLNGAGQFLNDFNIQTEQRQNKQDDYLKDGVNVISNIASAVSNVSSFPIGPFKVSVTKSNYGHEGSQSSSRSSKLNPSRVGGLISQASPATSSASASSSASATSSASASSTPFANLGRPFNITTVLGRPSGTTLSLIGLFTS